MSPTGLSTAELDRALPAEPTPEPCPPGRAKHRFYDRPVTPPLRDELAWAGVQILAARLPPSLARLNPVRRFSRVVNEWLDWLDAFAGASYQDRWLASGADSAGRTWAALCAPSPAGQQRAARALEAAISLGAVRPSYDFLFSVCSQRLWSTWREEHDQAVFARVGQAGSNLAHHQLAEVMISLARMSIRTGKQLDLLTCDDLLEFRTAMLAVKGEHNKVPSATVYFLSRQAGLFPDGPEDFRALHTASPLSPAEVVASYGVKSPVMSGLLSHYLAERRPALDYVSFKHMADHLCRLFWRDIETAHPGIDTHRLTRDQVEGWKQRVRTLPDGRPRQRFTSVYLAVRCFYLDINHWANDHPERWATWATPSPVTRQDVRSVSHQRRATTARMHARVRELLPELPALVHTVRSERDRAANTLRTGRATANRDYSSESPVDSRRPPKCPPGKGKLT
jgi:hypothetical protein